MRPIGLILLLIPLILCAQVPKAGKGNPQPGGVQAAPPPPPTPVADLAVLEGQVLNALSGAPLRKANINMNRQSTGRLAPGTRTSFSAVTDASGRFSITGIEPGTYRLNASHTGFLGMSYNARRPGGNGTPLELGRAQRMTSVTLKLPPQGVISGKVLDEDGDPLQGAQIQVMRLAYVNAKKQLQQVGGANTNDLGEYRVASITPGKYFVGATFRGRAQVQLQPGDTPQEDYVTTFYPGSTDLAAAAPIDIGPGDSMQGLNIRLNKVHTVRIRGRAVNNTAPAPTPAEQRVTNNILTNANGQTIEVQSYVNSVMGGLQVHLQPRNSLTPGNFNINTQVKPDGSFEFLSVVPGSYDLIAVANRGNKAHAVRQPIEVGNSNIENVNLVISPGAMLAGHVRYDGDPPQTGGTLTVRLNPAENMPGMPPPPPAKVDADGNFRFDDVNPEHYSVNINTPSGYYIKSLRAGSTDALAAGVDLTNGAASLDIVLGANPPQVSGSVVNSDAQQPATAVTVVLIPQEKERQGQSYFYTETTSDQYGNFTFNRVQPGEYKVYAWEDVPYGQWFDPEFMKANEGKGESVSAKEASPVTLKLTMIPAK